MGTLSGKIASSGLTPVYVNSAVNASAGKLYQCDTTSAAFTVTLPTGSTGSVLRFVDDAGTWGTHNLTIAPAATQTIQGISGNGSLVCDLSNAYVEMTWDATNSQWCVQTTGFQYGPPATSTATGTISREASAIYSNAGTTLTWTGVSAAPATYNIRFVRTGSIVTCLMTFSAVTLSSSAAVQFGTIDSAYRPSVNVYALIGLIQNATTNGTVVVEVTTAGNVLIYKDASAASAWVSGNTTSTQGVAVAFTYHVA